MTNAVRYSDTFMIRCQPGLPDLVERAARARGQKASEWARQALRAALQHEGIDPAALPALNVSLIVEAATADGET